MGRRALLVAGIAAAVAVNAICSALLWVQRRNTLEQGEGWRSAKVELERGVMGARAAVVTRPLLAGGRLNLGVYFGFQEIYRDVGEPIEGIRFRVLSSPGSYLDLLYGDGPALRDGVRLSQTGSQSFRLSRSGRFLQRRDLTLAAPLQADAWVQVEADIRGRRLVVDGRTTELDAPLGPVTQVGFRGCARDVAVDEVEIEVAGGTTISEGFGNERELPRALVLATAGWVALAVALHSLLARVRGGSSARSARRSLMAELLLEWALAASSLTLLAIDRARASEYPLDAAQLDLGPFQTSIEDEATVLRRLAGPVEPAMRRVFLVGSSQTWGAGAWTAAETWGAQLERRLRAELGGGPTVEVVNGGISGLKAASLCTHYRERWLPAYRPMVTVVDLGSNDAADESFESALRSLVEANRAAGVRTLLVLEPNSPETPEHVLERHAVMRRVAASTGVRAFDLHAHLKARAGEGQLWWDFVHLTSFGQQLVAESLAPEVLGLLGQ